MKDDKADGSSVQLTVHLVQSLLLSIVIATPTASHPVPCTAAMHGGDGV